jgi:hypothetical protein
MVIPWYRYRQGHFPERRQPWTQNLNPVIGKDTLAVMVMLIACSAKAR